MKYLSAADILDEFDSDDLSNIKDFLSTLYPKLNQINPIEESKKNFVFKNFKKININKEDYFFGLIVETRKVSSFHIVLKNFLEITDLKVLIICSDKNESFIRTSYVEDLIKSKKIFLWNMGDIEDLISCDYNKLLLSRELWSLLPDTKKIFIFQTDSFLCKKSQLKISDFKNFDYIGSPWDIDRPVGLKINGGSGGLSIRDIELSRKAIEFFDVLNWPGGEDGFFAFHIELLKGKVASLNEASKFSTQQHFYYKSYGCHKVSLLQKKYRENFYEYCPESTQIENPLIIDIFD